MNGVDHEVIRESIGALVLGQLAGNEARRLRAHLEECGGCRAEYDDLQPVANSLALLRADAGPHADPGAGLPPSVWAAIRSRVTTSSDTSRARPWVAATAGGVIGAAAAVALLAVVPGDRILEPEPVPLEAVTVRELVSGVDSSADLVDHTWGMEIKLAVTGLREGQPYRVFVRTADGTLVAAGGFVGVGGDTVECNMNSVVQRDDATAFVVRGSQGRPVLRARLT